MTVSSDRFLELIAVRKARIGIVGLGYVGLPVALTFAEAGFPTVGVEQEQSSLSGDRYLHLLGDEQPAATEPPLLRDQNACDVAEPRLIRFLQKRVVADVAIEVRLPPRRERLGEEFASAARA